MKKLIFVSIILILSSCDMPTTQDVEIEVIRADKDVNIAKEQTKQAEELTKQKELELKIIKENK